jgi:flagellar protein FlaG
MEVFNTVRASVAPQQVDTSSTVTNERYVEDSTRIKAETEVAKKGTNEDLNDAEKIKEDLDNAVRHLNLQAESLNTNVRFGFNDKIESMFVDVTERNTGKLIRKIPSEEAIKLAERLKEVVGMIFDEKL